MQHFKLKHKVSTTLNWFVSVIVEGQINNLITPLSNFSRFTYLLALLTLWLKVAPKLCYLHFSVAT